MKNIDSRIYNPVLELFSAVAPYMEIPSESSYGIAEKSSIEYMFI